MDFTESHLKNCCEIGEVNFNPELAWHLLFSGYSHFRNPLSPKGKGEGSVMSLAFGITAAGTDETSFLIYQQVRTLRALPGHVFNQSQILNIGSLSRRGLSFSVSISVIPVLLLVGGGMLFEDAGNCIRAG
jgi:hypothetical protein